MTETKPRILIAEDQKTELDLLVNMLADAYDLFVATDGPEVFDRLIPENLPSLILLDVRMPRMDGYQVCEKIKADPVTAEIPVIFITGLDSDKEESRGFEAGGVDYITKPFSPAVVKARIATHLSLQESLREAREAARLRREVVNLSRSFFSEEPQRPEAFQEIVTRDTKMRAIFRYLEAVCGSGEPVLITGETGVGKDLFAGAIHTLSGRRGPLVSLNTAGLDDQTFSDTLFGHLKGAFTGADRPRRGLVEEAEMGTLFLDEIGDLSPPSQIKLLQLLQTGLYYPLGADKPKRMNAAVVTATIRDLSGMLESESFRSDLYYRISGHTVHIPPL